MALARAESKGAMLPRSAALLLVAGLLAACSGSSSGSPTPLASDKLSGRTNAAQAESCAPLSNPAALVARSLVHITTPPDASGDYSSGTGIIIDQDWVLTNEHVIDGAQDQSLRLYFFDNDQSGRYDVLAPGKVVAADASLDLALVQTDTGGLPTVIWGDEGKLQNGSPLIAIGFPLGLPAPAISSGHFLETQVDRATGQAFIVSDVPLEHGESGGPMLNRCGQVVGINTARTRQDDLGLSLPEFGARRWALSNRPQ